MKKYKLAIYLIFISIFFWFLTILPPVVSLAQTTTYTLSSGYSSTQGANNWYYYYKTYSGSPTQATYGTAQMKPKDWFGRSDNLYWHAGTDKWMMLDQDIITGGNNEIGIIYWKAPAKGSATITVTQTKIENKNDGNQMDNGYKFGVGYTTFLGGWSNPEQEMSVARNNTQTKTIQVTKQVQGGDFLYYYIDSNGWTYGDTASYSISVNFTPAPTPSVNSNSSCTPTDTSSMYTISWSPSSPAITYVDISSDNFTSWYNKAVSGTSTNASSGFTGMPGTSVAGQSLTFQPNTTYKVRLWNGQTHSNTATFTTPSSCSQDTSGPASTCNVNVSYQSNPSAYAQWNGTCNGALQAGGSGGIGQSCCELACGADSQCDEQTSGQSICNSTCRYTPPTPTPTLTPTPTPTPTAAPTPTPTPTPSQLNINCPAGLKPIRLDGGLLSAINPVASQDRFATNNLCVLDPRAAIPQFSVPTYPKIKSLYYDQLKSNSSLYKKESPTDQDITQGTLTSTLKGNKDVIMRTSGNIVINGTLNLGGFSKVGVVFADGDLTIDKDINFGENSSTAGLVFIVGGNVHINRTVSKVNAFIITFGQFCSAWDNGSCPSSVPGSPQLTINGSIVSLPENAADKPKFVRSLTSNTQAAEKIVFQPKYLVILKDIFSRDLTIWKEIQ